jgi:hypothetical protein
VTALIERRHVASCVHGRVGFCAQCVTRHRLVASLLDELIADLDPPRPPIPRSTFGLTTAELRRHGNALHALGWPIEEIVSVLQIEEDS